MSSGRQRVLSGWEEGGSGPEKEKQPLPTRQVQIQRGGAAAQSHPARQAFRSVLLSPSAPSRTFPKNKQNKNKTGNTSVIVHSLPPWVSHHPVGLWQNSH